MDKRGKRLGSCLRLTPCEARQAGKHDLRLLKPHVADLGAVARVPAQRCPPEPPGVVDQEQDELERVRQSHVVEVGRGCERDRRVAAVERAAEASVRRALRGHEHMFPRLASERGTHRARVQVAACQSCANRASRRPFATLREPKRSWPENGKNPA